MCQTGETNFQITKENVIECAREMGIPDEAITDDVLSQVKKGCGLGTGVLVYGGKGSHKINSRAIDNPCLFCRGNYAQNLRFRR